MVSWNAGSLTTFVGNTVGWTTIGALSGTTLTDMAINEINFANTYTNDNIATTGIAEKYQPSLAELLKSQVMFATEMQQGGVDSATIGELSISQGAGGGAEIAKALRENAINRLKELGRFVRFTRVLAG